MKNPFSVVLVGALLIVACERDQQPEPAPATQNTIGNLITGKWRIAFNAYDVNHNHMPDSSEIELAEDNAFIIFNMNGTGIIEHPEVTRNMNWLINDKTISMISQEEDSTWSEAENYEIVSLTTTDMLLKSPDMIDSMDFFAGLVKQ